ncbi:lipopolysaccharide biosynthesis protein [Acinetobacter haemolyticus]|uniref:lipopolysaccharide biosynthesis protein n=1 Tax=Acinetobacter haemolyticus TaxID=29430 RepID=UPI000B2B8537|nr:lipopolysaccharide biosynthesis protein [Acinetobacter haemolyticus]QHI27677.1 lipopolysaccharide biosynthesis protein [Acinetobacter haemolyticus]
MNQNKQILKNTIFLYIRMLLVIVVSLYTVKIVYNALGIEGYGLFNLIAGFLLLFSFFNTAMRSATQRYLSVAIANKELINIRNTFSIALNIHFFIAIVIFLLLETLGLWLLNNFLNISNGLIKEANIVYQCAIFSSIIMIVSVPYQAIIISKEKMNYFAYIGIFEVFLKLIAAIFISYSEDIKNSLIFYSISLFLISILVVLIYIYCSFKEFGKEVRYNFCSDKKLYKDMLDFSSWNILGQISTLSSNQGVVLIFNILIGLTINASLAISQQVKSLLSSFVSNLQLAFNPQIVKSYAENNMIRHNILVLNSSKYSLFLVSIFSLPFLIYMEYILKLWLGGVLPEAVSFFAKVVILVAIIEALSGPLWMSAHARGNIKNYQIVVSIILLFNLPLTYSFLKTTESVELAFMSTVLISFILLIYRYIYFFKGRLVDKCLTYNYFKSLFLVFLFIGLIVGGKNFYFDKQNFDLLGKVISLLFIEFIYIIFLILFCFSFEERKLFKDIVKNRFSLYLKFKR